MLNKHSFIINIMRLWIVLHKASIYIPVSVAATYGQDSGHLYNGVGTRHVVIRILTPSSLKLHTASQYKQIYKNTPVVKSASVSYSDMHDLKREFKCLL